MCLRTEFLIGLLRGSYPGAARSLPSSPRERERGFCWSEQCYCDKMPSEVKQRKKQKNSEVSETSNGKDEAQKETADAHSVPHSVPQHKAPSSSILDLKTFMCLVSLVACAALTRLVLQQNERFSDMEDKYTLLHGRTANLFNMEDDVLKVSKKLAASEDDLREALSAVSLATRLQQDITALHAVVVAMQADENSASHDLQAVNARFLNVTETWQGRLTAVASDLSVLKTESREAHAGATEQVNEAERRNRALAERLEELEDSTRRNARALERTEGDDTKRAADQLDWNTKQIQKLQDQVGGLARREAELSVQLQEHVPRAQECEAHLPAVEEAVRSILRLTGDLSGAEKRLEEVTLQVFGTEDSMLKALNEILDIRQELDGHQAHYSIQKMKNELSVVKDAVRELTLVLRGSRMEGQEEEEGVLGGGWLEEVEEEEEEEKVEEEEKKDSGPLGGGWVVEEEDEKLEEEEKVEEEEEEKVEEEKDSGPLGGGWVVEEEEKGEEEEKVVVVEEEEEKDSGALGGGLVEEEGEEEGEEKVEEEKEEEEEDHYEPSQLVHDDDLTE